MRRLLPLAVAGAFLLAACGSSGGDSASSSTTQPGTAAERRLANAGLIQPTDLAGYAPGPANPSEAADLVDLAGKTESCATFVKNSPTATIKGRGASYKLGTTVADSSVAVFPTEADATAQLELYRDPAIITCLEDFYRDALGPARVQSISVSPVAPAGVTNGFGFLVTATLTAPGGTETRLIGIQGVQQGRALASINVSGTQENINQVMTTMLPKLEQQMAAAQA